MNENILEMKRVDAGYGEIKVLSDVSVELKPGEIVAVMGPNGAGKSTVLKALFGLIPTTSGKVLYRGDEILPLPSEMIERGIAFVPQGRRVFTYLTVHENLEVGGHFIKSKEVLKERIEEVLELFPELKKHLQKPSGSLSGGQQQMLAMARGLMTNPDVLLLDEPTLGLSPKIVGEMFDNIKKINETRGTAIVVVEHNIKSLLPIINRVYVLDKGQLVFEGTNKEFEHSQVFERVFLGHVK